MGTAFFVYTSIIIGIAVVTCSVSIVVRLMTRRRDCLIAAVGFAIYGLETSLIFYDEYIRGKNDYTTTFEQALPHPFLSCVLGILIIGCLWLWVMTRTHTRITPRRVAAIMVPITVGCCVLVPRVGFASALQQYLYWLLRDLSTVSCLVFCAWRYRRTATPAERMDLERSMTFFKVVCVLSCCIIFEDTFMILIFRPAEVMGESMLFWYLGERNISENLLMIACAAQLLKRFGGLLTVYARHPRSEGIDEGDIPVPVDDMVSRLVLFADDKRLSPREAEVLELAIKGFDVQNIASTLVLAPGTVKSHLHRIYSKAGVTGRDELIQEFWRS